MTIAHVTRFKKTTPTNFQSLEEALADFNDRIAPEVLAALQDHENTCIAEGAVTGPAQYEFDVANQELSIVKQTNDTAKLLALWIKDPLRASVKVGRAALGWRPSGEYPSLIGDAPAGQTLEQHLENNGVTVANIAAVTVDEITSTRP